MPLQSRDLTDKHWTILERLNEVEEARLIDLNNILGMNLVEGGYIDDLVNLGFVEKIDESENKQEIPYTVYFKLTRLGRVRIRNKP